MSKLYLDLAVTIFFLMTLVFVLNMKSPIVSRDKSSFKILAAGFGLFTMMSLFTTLYNQLLEHGVMSTSTTSIAEITRMTLFVLGLVLVTSAVARWLAVVGFKREESKRDFTNELTLNRILYESSNSSELKEYLSASLSLLADAYGLANASVYLVSKTGNSARLLAVESTFNLLSGVRTEVVFTPGWINGLTDSNLTYADEKVLSPDTDLDQNRYCFAVTYNGSAKFLYVLTAKHDINEQREQPQVLISLSNTFRNKLKAQGDILKLRHNKECLELARALKMNIRTSSSVNEALAGLKEELSNYLPIDFLSVCSIAPNGQGRRITIGESGTILNEVGVNVLSDSGYVLGAVNGNRTVTIENMTAIDTDMVPELLRVSSINSLLVLPLTGISGIRGAVTIGSKDTTVYTAIERERAEAGTSSFEEILTLMSEEERTETLNYRERIIQGLVTDIATADSVNSIFESAAATVNKIVNSTFVRIFTVDSEQKFISSRALINQSGRSIRVPANGHILLSLLPWHKISLTHGNTVMVKAGAGENRMANIESSQVFTRDVDGAVIVPIKFGDKTYGLISIAETETNITADKLQFVETIAAILALAVDSTNRSSESLAEFASQARAEIMESGKNRKIQNQMRSSLTSIIGSLEMIKASQTDGEYKDNRFIGIIDKSAHKLEELLKS